MGRQFFRVANEQFAKAVAQWQAAGWVAPWQPIWGGDHAEELTAEDWYVPVPRSSALCRHLVGEATTFFGQPVTALQFHESGTVTVERSDGAVVHGNRVVLAIPAPQAAPLLSDYSMLGTRSRGFRLLAPGRH